VKVKLGGGKVMEQPEFEDAIMVILGRNLILIVVLTSECTNRRRKFDKSTQDAI
jgi:hypothetical protein